jgi:hypothetical protein
VDSLEHAARELARAVDGVDWDAYRVERAVDALHAYLPPVGGADERDRALGVLVDRLARWRPEDADGTAHAALGAGVLVEAGAPPRRLGEVLLAALPGVLRAARRYADRCLAEPSAPSAGPEAAGAGGAAGDGDDDVLVAVAGHAIRRDTFRAHLAGDRPGACCLVDLRTWVLPAVAALTRDRELLLRATRDADLTAAAAALRDSPAHWLDLLLGVRLDEAWLVLCPVEGRAFRVRLDGVADNRTLQLLLAEELVPLGVPGTVNPPDVVAFCRGGAPWPETSTVLGSWNLYDYRAAPYDLAVPASVPTTAWVWGEGRPTDVPELDGVRTLLVGPQQPWRSWRVGRPFAALGSDVTVEAELGPVETANALGRARAAAAAG